MGKFTCAPLWNQNLVYDSKNHIPKSQSLVNFGIDVFFIKPEEACFRGVKSFAWEYFMWHRLAAVYPVTNGTLHVKQGAQSETNLMYFQSYYTINFGTKFSKVRETVATLPRPEIQTRLDSRLLTLFWFVIFSLSCNRYEVKWKNASLIIRLCFHALFRPRFVPRLWIKSAIYYLLKLFYVKKL